MHPKTPRLLAISVSLALAAGASMPAAAQTPAPKPVEDEKQDSPWYERLAFRGYAQLRFNRLYATDEAFKNDLGDKALAKDNSFSIRRARLILFGDVAPFLAIYAQVDAAGMQVAMRDWYGDIFLNRRKELRIRAGQSKVPYGFENMQSSQNRAPLDRSDPINSGAPGERDLGVFLYWEPAEVRKRFKYLVDSGLKGSGDYGVGAIGVYSGQGVNALDANDNRHVVGRVSYPFAFGKQILELGAGGYGGKYNVTKDVDTSARNDFRDARVIASVMLYPQPLGFQAEYTAGRGPERVGERVESRPLHGGYAMLLARVGDFFPFARVAYYDGGIKNQDDAPRALVRELVLGTEWQYAKFVELTAEVDVANRQLDGVGACDDGDTNPGCVAAVVRAQLQINY